MSSRVGELSAALDVDSQLLQKHVASMLPPMTFEIPDGWPRHEQLDRIHRVCDGFWLFGNQPWNGFQYLGYGELAALGSPDDLELEAEAHGLLPIYGHCPHYVSLRVSDGVILKSDWDNVGGEAWLVEIAPSLTDYIATLIEIREAFIERGERLLHPSDRWRPYAMNGSRLDA